MSSSRNRWLVLAVALAARVPLAFITFGTTDLANSLQNTAWLLSGLPAPVPYLPGVDLFLRIGGALAWSTALPVAFGYKVFPVLGDAVLALLIADVRSAKHGLLYALMPVPAMIAAMHGQWDALVLYPMMLALVLAARDTPRSQALAGAAWLISAVVKPFSLPLLLFVLPRNRKGAMAVLAGAASAGVLYLLILAAVGQPLTISRVLTVLQYARGGERLFGIPWHAPAPYGRLVALVPLAVVAALYWRRRLEATESVLAFLALTLAISGLAAQYLCWIVPFAIVCGRFRMVAVYTLIAGVFLTFYYAAPAINVPNVIALGAYGMLRPVAWLTPGTPPGYMRGVLQLFGNAAIPLSFLAIATSVVVRRGPSESVRAERNAFTPAIGAIVLVVFCAAWADAQTIPPLEYVKRVQERVRQYDVVVYRGPLLTDVRDTVWIPTPRRRHAFNLATLLLLWTAGASAALWTTKEKGPRV